MTEQIKPATDQEIEDEKYRMCPAGNCAHDDGGCDGTLGLLARIDADHQRIEKHAEEIAVRDASIADYARMAAEYREDVMHEATDLVKAHAEIRRLEDVIALGLCGKSNEIHAEARAILARREGIGPRGRND